MLRFLKLPANATGRDFIVGDVHGCFAALYGLLEMAGFDVTRDRLFSVGDLVDRGPNSEKCLQLIFEPWFHMVRGNHESMFCDAVANRITFMTRNDYFNERNGGAWTKPWFARNAPELAFWSQQLEALPYVIEVQAGENSPAFWVVHAELRASEFVLTPEILEKHVQSAQEDDASIFQWSRKLVHHSPVRFLPVFPGPIYCGHTPVAEPPHINAGHWFLDGGAGKWSGPGAFNTVSLNLICHQTGDVYSKDVSDDVYDPSKTV